MAYFYCGLLTSGFDDFASERPGTSYRVEIYSAVLNRLYLLCSFVKIVET